MTAREACLCCRYEAFAGAKGLESGHPSRRNVAIKHYDLIIKANRDTFRDKVSRFPLLFC
jgi:hypothetical protein